jgi:ACR3 family arsenite efflux pump ArsB
MWAQMKRCYQPLLIIAAAFAGLLVGFIFNPGGYYINFTQLFLMLLLYYIFLSIDISAIGNSFQNLKFTGCALAVNFFWTPLFAFLLGLMFFPEAIDLRVGFLMLLATPCTDWYLVFTALAKGKVELGLSILPLNLLLQIILLPLYLLIFFQSSLQFDARSILIDIAMVLLAPLLLAQAVRSVARKINSPWRQRLLQTNDNRQLLFLCLAVMTMFAAESELVFANPLALLKMLLPLLLFFVINFLLAQMAARKLKFSPPEAIALNMTTLARNSPLALAIAVAAFPDRPLLLLALVLGPLLELPVLTIAAHILLKMGAKGIICRKQGGC